jgi:hypothetical protein
MPWWPLNLGVGSSSSSAVAGEVGEGPDRGDAAFDKECAPDNPEIGDYEFVDSCAFPGPPDTIVTPTDPPIPIPPIDLGCYPMVVTGSVFLPNQSSAVADAFSVVLTYPTSDYCEPHIDFQLSIPCFVSFTEAYIDVEYDPALETAGGTAETIDSGDCDLGISLSIGLPCPTDLVGGIGTVEFDGSIPLDEGEAELLVIPADDYYSSSGIGPCDFVLSFNLRLPCPTGLTGGIGTAVYEPGLGAGGTTLQVTGTGGCDYELVVDMALPCPGTITPQETSYGKEISCIPADRRPEIELWAEQSPGSCDFQLGLSLNIPCPVDWHTPKLKVVKRYTLSGPPSGTFYIVGSSSQCADDCYPSLDLRLYFPCPVEFTATSQVAIEFSGSGGLLPWAQEPTANLRVNFYDSGSGAELCSPDLQLALNLPCPVSVETDSVPGDVTFLDSYFYTELPADLDFPERSWAFGGPQITVRVREGKVAGQLTPCLPILDLSLNMPCPTGGAHRSLDDDLLANPFVSLIMKDRQERYQTADPDRYEYHPYYSLLPAGSVNIHQNLEWFRNSLQWGDSYGPSWAHGHWAKNEFDDDCNLDLQLSLFIPCGKRSPDVNFYHISDVGNSEAEPLNSLEYSALPVQDWVDGPFAGDCAFNEELRLFITPGGGSGGTGGRFARITDKYGCLPPFVYSAVEVWMNADFEWIDRPGGTQIASNMLNVEEQGYGGQWVSALVTGDVVVFWTVSNASNQTLYACSRSHYRGTF